MIFEGTVLTFTPEQNPMIIMKLSKAERKFYKILDKVNRHGH